MKWIRQGNNFIQRREVLFYLDIIENNFNVLTKYFLKLLKHK